MNNAEQCPNLPTYLSAQSSLHRHRLAYLVMYARRISWRHLDAGYQIQVEGEESGAHVMQSPVAAVHTVNIVEVGLPASRSMHVLSQASTARFQSHGNAPLDKGAHSFQSFSGHSCRAICPLIHGCVQTKAFRWAHAGLGEQLKLSLP